MLTEPISISANQRSSAFLLDRQLVQLIKLSSEIFNALKDTSCAQMSLSHKTQLARSFLSDMACQLAKDAIYKLTEHAMALMELFQ